MIVSSIKHILAVKHLTAAFMFPFYHAAQEGYDRAIVKSNIIAESTIFTRKSPLPEGKGRGWGLITHDQRNYRHFSHFAIALGLPSIAIMADFLHN
jgi:hypothetical protein